jgi:hypothetical protein
MKKILLLTFTAFTFLLLSCSSSLNSFSEYDKSTDFQQYTKYAWLPSDTSASNPDIAAEKMYGKMIMAYSNDILKKKGMLIDNQNPDAVFRFAFGLNSKMEYKQSPTVSVGVGYSPAPGFYSAAMVPVSGGNVTASRADEVFLVIDMVDVKTGKVIWTSGIRKNVDNTADSKKNMQLALQSIYSNLKIKHKTR